MPRSWHLSHSYYNMSGEQKRMAKQRAMILLIEEWTHWIKTMVPVKWLKDR